MQLRVDRVKACSINGKLIQLWNSYGPGVGPQASGAIAKLQGYASDVRHSRQTDRAWCLELKISNSFVDISEARQR